MDRRLRTSLWVVVAIQTTLALGFAFERGWAVDTWPFDGRGPLSNIFVGSIFAAAAGSAAWCLLVGSRRALAGLALDYAVILAPLGGYSLALAGGGSGSRAHFALFGLVALSGAAVGVVLLRSSLRTPWRSARPTPRLVLASFGVFVVGLVVIAALLLARVSVLPWPVTDELSTLVGLMFLGAAAYFAYGLADRRWENAGGQLAGFLAYDAVLLVPFLQRLPTVSDEFRLELVVYTAVLVYSGLLALWYLALDRRTRSAHLERVPEQPAAGVV
jgi:hypothetical protein